MMVPHNDEVIFLNGCLFLAFHLLYMKLPKVTTSYIDGNLSIKVMVSWFIGVSWFNEIFITTIYNYYMNLNCEKYQ